jgi:hypothetical protein
MAFNVIQREERNRNEPIEKDCQVCGELKQSSHFKPLPIGGRSNTCNECFAEKSKEKDKRLISSEETIQSELWKQYDKAQNTSEKIRCLEALVKLRPTDKQSSLDEASVIASMMKSIKAKKKTEAQSESSNGQ